MIRSHVIFAFYWFRSDSLFASIRFFPKEKLYLHSVGFAFRWFCCDSLFASIRLFPKEKLYSHSVGFALCWFRSDSLFASIRFFRKDSQSCSIHIPLVSQFFVICIYSFFAMIRIHSVNMLYSHSVGFTVIRSSHLFVFRNDSQSCYIRIPLVSHLSVIRIYSFFAMIRSYVIFAFRWFRSDSLFASISFSRLFAVMLYSHSVGFVVIRYLHLFLFRNDSQSCYIRIPLVSH